MQQEGLKSTPSFLNAIFSGLVECPTRFRGQTGYVIYISDIYVHLICMYIFDRDFPLNDRLRPWKEMS